MSATNGISQSILEHHWSGLTPDHPDLVYALAERMEAMLVLPRAEQGAAAAGLLDLEASFPDAELRTFLGAELRALTTLPPEGARTILATIESLTGCAKGDAAMRRTVAFQAACRDLSLDEISHLEAALPSIREMAGLPTVRLATPHGDGSARQALPGDDRGGRWSLGRLFGRG